MLKFYIRTDSWLRTSCNIMKIYTLGNSRSERSIDHVNSMCLLNHFKELKVKYFVGLSTTIFNRIL